MGSELMNIYLLKMTTLYMKMLYELGFNVVEPGVHSIYLQVFREWLN